MAASYITDLHMSTRCLPLVSAKIPILTTERCTASWGANRKLDKSVSDHYSLPRGFFVRISESSRCGSKRNLCIGRCTFITRIRREWNSR